MLQRLLWLIVSFFVVTSVGFSQCYDLSSTRLYEPQGRLQEWWSKPIWYAKPGEGNFHLDEPGWGRPFHFALFVIGTIRKTPEGWIAYRARRRDPDVWCDPTPQRSGMICYTPPFQVIPPTATIRIKSGNEVDEWSVSPDGIVRYVHENRGAVKVVENRSSYKLLPKEFGGRAQSKLVAVLNLSTGEYSLVQSGYFDGAYIRHYPGSGVKLTRIDEFRAKAKLHEVPCPGSLQQVSFTRAKPTVVEMTVPEACAVKFIKDKEGNQVAVNAVWHWEFVRNPQKVASPEKCIQVFASPTLPDPLPVVVASSDHTATAPVEPQK